MENNLCKIGMLGLGNIGSGAYTVLEKEREWIRKRTGVDFEFAKILVRDPARPRPVEVPPELLTSGPGDILENPEIDIVVEVLGGIHPAVDYMVEAMNRGKHVVTANKAAVADSYELLLATAEKNRVMFRCEASVGGAIPCLTAIENALLANRFEEVYGILNGTTNYILTKMGDEGLDYETALAQAKEKGFAEPDPTADVEGIDVANKLAILVGLCFGVRVRLEDIPTTGITGVTKDDIEAAKARGNVIKLIASARYVDGKLVTSVAPTELPKDHMLAAVKNELNALWLKTTEARELLFYGRGAGPLPTGSAVMGDVIDIGRAIAKNAAYDIVVPGRIG